MSTGRPYMSIGEVLAALQAEFPDASVSKIRFLEGEGLIAPERTASGYRKFYQRDLDRLRFVLKLQRDSFLPLKIIRERLAAADAGAVSPEEIATPAPVIVTTAVSTPTPSTEPAEPEESLTDVPAPAHMTEADLAAATGLELKQVQALREFGVICEHRNGGGAYFDGDDVHIGKLAREFLNLGIEPRHLKILRRFAEQEAALFEQLVVPAMRTRRPDARQQAAGTLTQLAKLSRALRQTYLHQSLRATLNGER